MSRCSAHDDFIIIIIIIIILILIIIIIIRIILEISLPAMAWPLEITTNTPRYIFLIFLQRLSRLIELFIEL